MIFGAGYFSNWEKKVRPKQNHILEWKSLGNLTKNSKKHTNLDFAYNLPFAICNYFSILIKVPHFQQNKSLGDPPLQITAKPLKYWKLGKAD